MADTQRTITQLLTLFFQDGQAAGSITPQDMRDLIISTGAPSFGGCGMTGNATATVISVAGTFVKVLGTTTEESSSSDFTITNNRLTYNGVVDINFFCSADISMTCDSSSQVVAFQIAKNGSLIGTPIHRKIGTGSDLGVLSVSCQTTLSPTNYIEVFVTNDSGTANITADDLHFAGTGQVV